MIRRPPRSTLFPYTPLSRSVKNHARLELVERRAPAAEQVRRSGLNPSDSANLPVADQALDDWRSHSDSIRNRSEEHTSELQSRQYLVCRLLLEKKNNDQSGY